jgi:hypothetical protein
VSDASRPPLRRIHTDATLASGAGALSLAYWRRRETEEVVESLRPGKPEALRVKADGRVINGNVRLKVLEERGFDVDALDREAI